MASGGIAAIKQGLDVMGNEDGTLIDTRDMVCIHDVFRRAFADAPGQIAAVATGDSKQVERLASYLGEVLWLLHAHHSGEDELLYPLLIERAPENGATFSRMEAQHQAVAASIESAQAMAGQFGRTGSAQDGEALSAAIRSLSDMAKTHLAEEESEVLPIAARVVTEPEWGALPGHVLAQYPGSRLWLLLGLVFEAMPDDLRAQVLANVPPPVSEMWFGFGSDAFTSEIASVRRGAA